MSDGTDSEKWRHIKEAIAERKSTRAFLPDPVPLSRVLEILDAAKRAPSGGNLQPWQVHVMVGEKKMQLEKQLVTAFFDKKYKPSDPYHYYPRNWEEPFAARRRKVGEQLYGVLNIGKRDIPAMRQQKAENLRFFGAPIGLFFTISSKLEQGSWLDMGLFIANVMTLARGAGLDTCPEASFISYHGVIREALSLPDDELLVCGMALGFADPDHPANSFRTDRQDLKTFVTVHQDPPRTPIQDLSARIKKNAHHWPNKAALVQDGKTVSWRDFSEQVDKTGQSILRNDPQGSRVAVQLPNSAAFVYVFFGGVKAGRNVQVFDPAWPLSQTAKVMQHVQPDLVINDQASLLPVAVDTMRPWVTPDIDAPFYTGFTSGSTGQPKGFVRNQSSWLKSFACDTEEFDLASSDVIAALGNFTHSLPLYAVVRALYEGATAVFYETFRPKRILADIDRQKVTILYAVPTQLQALIAAAAQDQCIPAMRLILSSGAKCSSDIRENLKTLFPNATFAEFYGSSELSYVSLAKEIEGPPSGSVGRPLKEVVIRILGDKGQELSSGEKGRIFVESPYQFMGYAGTDQAEIDNPGETERKGLFVGDTGFVDSQGFLYLTGRADRMILSAARNIFPEEIERHLMTHPAITNVAVFGIPDKKRGEKVAAVVQSGNAVVSASDLSVYCRQHMASYLVPRHFFKASDWPLTVSAKTDLVDLKSRLLKGELDPLS